MTNDSLGVNECGYGFLKTTVNMGLLNAFKVSTLDSLINLNTKCA